MNETWEISSHSTNFALPNSRKNTFICAKGKQIGTKFQNIQNIHDTVKHMGSPENIYVMKQTVAAIFVLSTWNIKLEILNRWRQTLHA